MRWARWAHVLIRLAVTALLCIGAFLLAFFQADSVRMVGTDLLRSLSRYAFGRALFEWLQGLEPVEMALSVSGLVLTVGFSWALKAIARGPVSVVGRQEVGRRRRIANALLQNLDLHETHMGWQTTMFTDFAVSRESVRRPRRRWNPFSHRTKLTYQTSSLTDALEHQPSRFTLLQGPPGAGKSVAMRYYARILLKRAIHTSTAAPLPLWVNLRDFDVRDSELTVDSFRRYLAGQVNPTGARELTAYLREDLEQDLTAGRAVLLLDSFDEIPAILGSSHIDVVVERYLRIISDFLGGGQARCVIAAREYKAPRPGWFTRVEIVGLQFEEQVTLLKSAGLSTEHLQAVEPLLHEPRNGFAADLRNPLHLSLLADYVKATGCMPERPSALFEQYVRKQLSSMDTLQSPDEVQLLEAVLESHAFALLRSPTTGLTGDVEGLRTLIAAAAPPGEVDRLVDAAQKSTLFVRAGAAGIAFVHRRVQEYLATKFVLAHPDALGTAELVLDGRWRETTVALLQLGQHKKDLHPHQKRVLAHLERVLAEQLTEAQATAEFDWTVQAIHVLELLVAAYSPNPNDIPHEIADLVSALVALGWRQGGIGDRKFALDCLPIVKENLQLTLINDAFTGRSHWLRRSVLRDCAALAPLPDSVDAAIRRLLITLMSRRRLSREATVIDSELRRLYGRRDLQRARRYLSILPRTVGISTVAILMLPTVAFPTATVSLAVATYAAEVFWLWCGPFNFWQLQISFSYPQNSRLRKYLEPALTTAGDELDPVFTTLGLAIWSLFVFLFLSSIGMFATQSGQTMLGYLVVTAALLTVLGVVWAVSFLVSFHRRRFSAQLRTDEILWPFPRPDLAQRPAQLRSAFTERRFWAKGMRGLLRAVGIGLFVLSVLALIFAVIAIGAWMVVRVLGAQSANALLITLFIVTIATLACYALYIVTRRTIRETKSWLRFRYRIANITSPTPDDVRAFMLNNLDPMDIADFLRRMRTGHVTGRQQLPRKFVRGLINLIESETRSLPRPRDLDESLLKAMTDGRLPRDKIRSWQGDVLDELGRIDESLRER